MAAFNAALNALFCAMHAGLYVATDSPWNLGAIVFHALLFALCMIWVAIA